MTVERASRLFDKVYGCLLGGLIGDAMGSPAENKTYREIEAKFGRITDFSGAGTDDSALKHILCDAIIRNNGYPTADAWAEEWINQEELFLKRNIFWTPVMNSFWKLRGEGVAPWNAGDGNMSSSSSAMCISPVGIVNAGNPRQAALEAFDVASLIHHNFCRDAAAVMAAAVAAAFDPAATVESILESAVAFLPSGSAATMREFCASTVGLARETQDYGSFREKYYAERLLPGIATPDARETVPVALALFHLANGDPEQTVIAGANFGRDADTIASMAGAIAGAYRGASVLPAGWVEKATAGNPRDQAQLARKLVDLVLERNEAMRRLVESIQGLDKRKSS